MQPRLHIYYACYARHAPCRCPNAPRTSSPNPTNGVRGVLLVCASVSQLLTAIEIELYILSLPNIFIIHLDRLAIPAQQTSRTAYLLTSRNSLYV